MEGKLGLLFLILLGAACACHARELPNLGMLTILVITLFIY
jgi:hypothetical protein